jgi:hypothetical protein
MLAMRPEEFWRTTPAEMAALAEGYGRRERREWEKFAWLAANIMNCWTKRRIRIRDLLPGSLEDAKMGEDGLDRAALEEIARANKAKFWTKISDDILKPKAKEN